MEVPGDLVTRRISPVIVRALNVNPVVLLEGPRSVGKSTEVTRIAAGRAATVLNLDSEPVREAVLGDTERAIDRPGLVCVDEYQRVPGVLQAIKFHLGSAPTPGRFLLAGSTRHAALPEGTQALTGRLNRRTIFPLAQSEIDRTAPDLVAALFQDPLGVVDAHRDAPHADRQDYVARALRGGFPPVLTRADEDDRAEWFDDYVALTLDRDARELAAIRQSWVLPDLLGRLAAQTGEGLNVAALAQGLPIGESAAREYVRLLENAFLIYTLPAWGKVRTKRTFVRPKVHVLDSGVAGRLLGLTPEILDRVDSAVDSQFGHLLETFVVGELLKEAAWTAGVNLEGYWRTYEGDEVDTVLRRRDGAIVAVEVKATRTPRPRDFSGLIKLRDILGDQFRAGVLLTTGREAYTRYDRIHVLPIDALWRPPPSP